MKQTQCRRQHRHNVADNTSLGLLEQSLDRIAGNHSIILGGDFNLPDWDWTTNSLKPGCNYVSNHEKLIDIIEDHSLHQHVKTSTRGDNILDLLLTNRPNSIVQSQVIPGISDHDTALVELEVTPIRIMKKPREIPLFKSALWDDFRDSIALKGQEITSTPPDADVNSLWCTLRDALIDGTKKFIPHKRSKSKIDLPYLTSPLRRLIRRRDRLYDKIKKLQRNISNHASAAALKSRYKRLKAQVQSEVRRAYWAYIEKVIMPLDTDKKPSKSFWSFVRRNRTERMGISALKSPDTGHQVGDAKGKADILNHQFQSAFTTETPITEAHAKPQLFPNMPDICFTENGIQKLLSGLDPNKACGPDQVLPRVLKELATQLAPFLLDLFNRSYDLGTVPNDWRHANVSPVYKKGKKILAVNYRPISLTCVCCKIFEHVIASAIMSHAQQHNILLARNIWLNYEGRRPEFSQNGGYAAGFAEWLRAIACHFTADFVMLACCRLNF